MTFNRCIYSPLSSNLNNAKVDEHVETVLVLQRLSPLVQHRNEENYVVPTCGQFKFPTQDVTKVVINRKILIPTSKIDLSW